MRLGTGLSDSERDNPNIQSTIGVNTTYGAYLKLQMSYETITPYAIVGYTESELDLESTLLNIAAEEGDSDISYGIGLEGPLSEKLSLTFEYMRYYNKDDITIDAFSVGAIARF